MILFLENEAQDEINSWLCSVMLIVLQKMVKEDGEDSPEFADAEEGDIQFALM